MITVDTIQFEELEKDLKAFHSRAFPFATKNTLNSAAFKARELWQKDIRVKMITRNKFTERSVLVEQSRTLNVRRQSASVGSTSDYMDEQEFGGVKRKTGKHGVAIATGFSAGQDGQQPRTRIPRKGNRLANIQLRKRRRKGKSKKQSNGFKIWDAIASGKRFVFLDLGRKKGVFRVVGGSRKHTERARLKMVADMSEQSVEIPRNPTLAPVIKTTQILMPAMYRKAIIFQAKRQGLFK